MKKIFCLGVVFVLAGACYAQQQPKAGVTVSDSVPYYARLYQNAMIFGDYLVAKDAMFNMLTINPTRIDYIDSLARLYYALGSMQQSLLSAKLVLEKQPDNADMNELSAICYDALGSKKEALDTYESLYKKSKSIYHLYQIAILQFTLQRWGECTASCETVLKDPAAAEKKVTIAYDQNSSQEVPMTAAIHNLRGVMYKELKEEAKAKLEFEEALKIFADFALAKSNLEIMNKTEADTKEKSSAPKKK